MSTSGTVPLHHLYLHPMNHQRMIKFSFESDEQDIQIYVVINIEYDPRVLELLEVVTQLSCHMTWTENHVTNCL
jgi:hypothetical protein